MTNSLMPKGSTPLSAISSGLPRHSLSLSSNRYSLPSGLRRILPVSSLERPQGGRRDEQGREGQGWEHVGHPHLLQVQQPQAQTDDENTPGGDGGGDHGIGHDGVEKVGTQRERALHDEHRPRREQDPPPEHRGEGERRDEVQRALEGQEAVVAFQAVLEGPDHRQGPHAEQEARRDERPADRALPARKRLLEAITEPPESTLYAEQLADDEARDHAHQRYEGVAVLQGISFNMYTIAFCPSVLMFGQGRDIRRGTEAVGYPHAGPAFRGAVHLDALDQEPHELPAGGLRLLGVRLDLGDTLPQRNQPCLCRLGEVLLLLLASDLGLHGVEQQLEVLGLVLEVLEVGGELRVVQVALGVEPDVAVLLGLFLAEPARQVRVAFLQGFRLSVTL